MGVTIFKDNQNFQNVVPMTYLALLCGTLGHSDAVPMLYLALYCYPMEDFMAALVNTMSYHVANTSYHPYAYHIPPGRGRSSREIWEYGLSYLVPGAEIFRKIDPGMPLIPDGEIIHTRVGLGTWMPSADCLTG